MKMEIKFIGPKLKFLLKTRHIRQKDLDQKLGLRSTTISNYINNINYPSLPIMVEMANYFNKDLSWFFTPFTEEDKKAVVDIFMNNLDTFVKEYIKEE